METGERKRIRCVPILDETDSCVLSPCAPSMHARSKLPSQNVLALGGAERAWEGQQSIDQSINHSLNQSIRARSRFRTPAARFCKAMSWMPTSLPRLSHAAAAHGGHGRRRPAYNLAHMDSCIDGIKGPFAPRKPSIGRVTDLQKKKSFWFQPSVSTVAGQCAYSYIL